MSSVEINEKLLPIKEFVLYDGKGENKEIILNDSVENYKYIEIFGISSSNYTSQKAFEPNGKRICFRVNYKMNTYVIDVLTTYLIQDNKITPIYDECGYSSIGTNQTCSFIVGNPDREDNWFYICRVIGYK